MVFLKKEKKIIFSGKQSGFSENSFLGHLTINLKTCSNKRIYLRDYAYIVPVYLPVTSKEVEQKL